MMRKILDLVRVDGADAEVTASVARHIVDAASVTLLPDPHVAGLQVDIARVGTRARFSRRAWPDLAPVHALVARWLRADALDAAVLPGITSIWRFAVTEHVGIAHVGIDHAGDRPDGAPSAGMKHVSLLCATVPTIEFRAAYRHHVALVREHLPGMSRYVQNDVETAFGASAHEIAAVSELSYRNEGDYERRWAKGPAGEAEFRSHEGFLDLPRTVTLLCTETVLRSPPHAGPVGDIEPDTR